MEKSEMADWMERNRDRISKPLNEVDQALLDQVMKAHSEYQPRSKDLRAPVLRRPQKRKAVPLTPQPQKSIQYTQWALGFAAALLLFGLVIVWLSQTPALDQRQKNLTNPSNIVDKKEQKHKEQLPPSQNPKPQSIDPQPTIATNPPTDEQKPKKKQGSRAQFASLVQQASERVGEFGTIIPADQPRVANIINELIPLKDELSNEDVENLRNFLLKTRKPSETLGMIIPAYFPPEDAGLTCWNKLKENAKNPTAPIPIIAIANPDNGPGNRADEGYAGIMSECTLDDDNVFYYKILGFVNCSNKSPTDIKKDVAKWVSLYPEIRGIYFHSHKATKNSANDWSEIFQYTVRSIRSKRHTSSPLIVSNPDGEWDDEFYNITSPNILYFGEERPYGDRLPLWPINHPRISLGAIRRVAPTDNPKKIEAPLQSALASHLTWFYIGPARRDELPNFIADEREAFREVNKEILRLNGK